jgi:hypothetical protein
MSADARLGSTQTAIVNTLRPAAMVCKAEMEKKAVSVTIIVKWDA